MQEAHKMVQEANVKRAHAEKALAESEMKVSKSSSRMFMFTYIKTYYKIWT